MFPPIRCFMPLPLLVPLFHPPPPALEAESCSVAQTGLELEIFLFQLSEGCNYGHVPLPEAINVFNSSFFFRSLILVVALTLCFSVKPFYSPSLPVISVCLSVSLSPFLSFLLSSPLFQPLPFLSFVRLTSYDKNQMTKKETQPGSQRSKHFPLKIMTNLDSKYFHVPQSRSKTII